VEKDLRLYLSYLQPLLDQKNSTYKLVPKSGLLWTDLDALEIGDLLPKQELLHRDDPRIEQPNDTLLFVANFGYYPKKRLGKFESLVALTIHQLLTASRAHSLFHRYGLIRMLMWVHDNEKNGPLPRVVSYHRKFALEADISCKHIYEIAGMDIPAVQNRRERSLDLESARAVQKRMIEAGVTTPKSRIGDLQRSVAAESPLDVSEQQPIYHSKREAELDVLIKRHTAKEFCAYYDSTGQPIYLGLDDKGYPVKPPLNSVRVPEYQRMIELGWKRKVALRKGNDAELLLQEYDSIISDYRDASLKLPDKSGEAEKKLKEAKEKLAQWRENLAGMVDRFEEIVMTRIEDRKSLRQDPPLLMWDRREAEPLTVKSTEFFPEHEMALLDFHPKSIWPIFRGEKLTNYDHFDFLTKGLFIAPKQSLVQGLKSIAPGADEWILPKCPSLTDLANGGVADLASLTVRSVNEKQWKEIMEQWMKWPLRPTKGELMVRTGTVYEVDSEQNEIEARQGRQIV
jgi:transcription factor 1